MARCQPRSARMRRASAAACLLYGLLLDIVL